MYHIQQRSGNGVIVTCCFLCRCFHTLPYDDKYLQEALDVSEVVSVPPKTKYTLVRYNQRGADTRHPPCHLKKRTSHKLKPLRRKILVKARDMHKQAVLEEARKVSLISL